MSYNEHGGGGYPPRDQDNSQYPPPPGEEDDRARAYHHRGPSNSGQVTLPSISPYEPQHHQQGLPNPYPDPRGYPPQDPYRGAPQPYRDDRSYYPPPPQELGRGGPSMSFTQSAPRQRTAIACRYCRRRKIRCSGFDQNPEGRCSNCQRFQQECIFTPVSSQAQAFVPAHAVYPNMRNMGVGPDGRPRPMGGYPAGTQLYGAHGQPLGPIPAQHTSQALPSPQSQYSPQHSTYDYPQPSPTISYNSYGDDRPPLQHTHSQDSSRKRPQQEPHPSILPPPLPGQSYPRADNPGVRRAAAEDDLRLPPVTPGGGMQSAANYSPGSSTSSHSNLQPPQAVAGSSLSRTPPPRTSPADGRSDPMSLGSIIDRRPEQGPGDIDRNMLGRLDRKN